LGRLEVVQCVERKEGLVEVLQLKDWVLEPIETKTSLPLRKEGETRRSLTTSLLCQATPT
jgi:hypothetical protein